MSAGPLRGRSASVSTPMARPATTQGGSSFKERQLKMEHKSNAIKSARFERHSNFGNALIEVNPSERLKLERQLRLLELERKVVVDGIFRKQRDFFVKSVFDKQNDLRFLKHKQRRLSAHQPSDPPFAWAEESKVAHTPRQAVDVTGVKCLKDDVINTSDRNAEESNSDERTTPLDRHGTLRKQRSISDVLFLKEHHSEPAFRRRSVSFPLPSTSRLVNHSVEKFKGLLLKGKTKRLGSTQSNGSTYAESESCSQSGVSDSTSKLRRVRFDSSRENTKLSPIPDADSDTGEVFDLDLNPKDSVFKRDKTRPSTVCSATSFPVIAATLGGRSQEINLPQKVDKNKNVQKWIELVAEVCRNKDLIRKQDELNAATELENEQYNSDDFSNTVAANNHDNNGSRIKNKRRLAKSTSSSSGTSSCGSAKSKTSSGDEIVKTKISSWYNAVGFMHGTMGRYLPTEQVGEEETEALLKKITGSLPQNLQNKHGERILDMKSALGYHDRNRKMMETERKVVETTLIDERFRNLMTCLTPLKRPK